MRHNPWLNWKIKHGLAAHGRAAGVLFEPTTRTARVLAKIFLNPVPSSKVRGERVFKQDVGGAVGPTGTMNGE